MLKKIQIFTLCFFIVINSFGQIAHGELPKSFSYPQIINSREVIYVDVDTQKLFEKREIDCKEGCAKQIGFFVENEISIESLNNWITLPDGSLSFLAAFHLEEAQGVGISFSKINIPDGAKLFVYNSSFQNVYGYFDQSNVLSDNSFSIQPVAGNTIHLEINCKKENAHELTFIIDGFAYFFETDFFNKSNSASSGQSGDCQVNVNCPEGLSVRQGANAVVKIIVYGSNAYYLCTGSLVNNTKHDRTPYLLSAQHCAQKTTTNIQYQKWQFYFSYESSECADNQNVTEDKTLIGCVPVALYDLNIPNSSDFLLVKLMDPVIPSDYYPYFAGWDVTNNTVSTAKSVHHPNGDIKKVSVTDNIKSSKWVNSTGSKLTHLKVVWKKTQSGYGTTEGGSSGAPLFNSQGKIIGTLTGGFSSCSNLLGEDYYGKLSYSWNSNSPSVYDSTKRLDCWLDPLNLGVLSWDGFVDDLNVNNIVYSLNNSERYTYGNPTVLVGSNLSFQASFFGEPDSCYWEFEGGEPSSSKRFMPESITYNNYGTYSINLTLYKEGFPPKYYKFTDHVRVTPNYFPNPFDNVISLVFNKEVTTNDNDLDIKKYRLIDTKGGKAYFPNKIEQNYNNLNLYFDNLVNGVYILQLISEKDIINIKLIKTTNSQ